MSNNYFGKSRKWLSFDHCLRIFLFLSWAWWLRIRRIQSFRNHRDQQLKIKELLTINKLLHFVPGLWQPESYERIFKFLYAYGSVLFFVQGVEVFSQLFECVVWEVDKLLFPPVLEPGSFPKSAAVSLLWGFGQLLVETDFIELYSG